MSGVKVTDFAAQANASWFNSRDLVVRENGATSEVAKGRLGRWSITASSQADNLKTLVFFRLALKNEFGQDGVNAFDRVLSGRLNKQQSLRAGDVNKTLAELNKIIVPRLKNELIRQIETHPSLFGAGDDQIKGVITQTKDAFIHLPISERLVALNNMSQFIGEQIEKAVGGQTPNLENLNGAAEEVNEIKPTDPTGLLRLKETTKISLRGRETSVEDRMTRGLKEGMRINRDGTNPMLLDKLKTNGVEPGFIYKDDWSVAHTKSYLGDTTTDSVRDRILTLAHRAPEGSAQKEDAVKASGYLERHERVPHDLLTRMALRIGPIYPITTAFAAEYMMKLAQRTDLDINESSALAKLRNALTFNQNPLVNPDGPVTPEDKKTLIDLKKKYFALIRDAVMEGPPDGDSMKGARFFKQFTERHIVKLDYNESDRTELGLLRLPKRVGKQKGVFFRSFRLTTRQSASVGAVAEALANDLTRVAGVPAQDLTLLRGKYEDGTPKLMLEAKFADGYSDIENGFLKDGRIVQHGKAPVENIARYKAFFLLLADRDAIGSHGQNKGFINGKFFAIDPGHSLEGNAKNLDISDNFSFTFSGSLLNGKKAFSNYSVFDDASRFEKFKGIRDLRQIKEENRFAEIFNSYREAFEPGDAENENERKLREEITTRINKMEDELNTQMNRLLTIFKPQLDAYDALSTTSDLQEPAIEMIENLEKLTSPTTWKSAHGEVNLTHLEVKPSTRISWTIKVEGDRIVYSTDKKLDEQAQKNLNKAFSDISFARPTPQEKGTRIEIPLAQASFAFQIMKEDLVQRITHPEEYHERTKTR